MATSPLMLLRLHVGDAPKWECEMPVWQYSW